MASDFSTSATFIICLRKPGESRRSDAETGGRLGPILDHADDLVLTGGIVPAVKTAHGADAAGGHAGGGAGFLGGTAVEGIADEVAAARDEAGGFAEGACGLPL